MKSFLGSILLVTVLVGCEEVTRQFTGKVVLEKRNERVHSVSVILPAKATLYSRKQVGDLVKLLESITVDLKNAQEQFPIKEEPPQTQDASKR